jgi:hypothetical protein
LILDGTCSFPTPEALRFIFTVDYSSLQTLVPRRLSPQHASVSRNVPQIQTKEEDLNRAQVLAVKKNHEPDQNFLSTLLSSSCN